MRNPFAKDHTTAWVATIAIGAIAAAAAAYFYFTRRDDEIPEEHHEPDYLKHPGKKKKKTDPHDLEPIAPENG